MSGDASALGGAWEITSRLTAGKDDREPDDDAKFLWLVGGVIVTGDDWAAWEMSYVARSGSAAGEIDVTRADRTEPWLQRGIFDVAGDVLRVCLAAEAAGARPGAFSSTVSNGCVLYVARRSEKPLPE